MASRLDAVWTVRAMIADLEQIDADLETMEDGSHFAAGVVRVRTLILGTLARLDALGVVLAEENLTDEPKQQQPRDRTPAERRKNRELREAVENVEGDEFTLLVSALRTADPSAWGSR